MNDLLEEHEDGLRFHEEDMFYKKGRFGEKLKDSSFGKTLAKARKLHPKQPPVAVDEKDKKNYTALKIKLVKSTGTKVKASLINWPVFYINPTRNPLLTISHMKSTKL